MVRDRREWRKTIGCQGPQWTVGLESEREKEEEKKTAICSKIQCHTELGLFVNALQNSSTDFQ